MKGQIIVTIILLTGIGIGTYLSWENIIVADFITQIVAGAILISPFILLWGLKPIVKYFHGDSEFQYQKKIEHSQKINNQILKPLSELLIRTHRNNQCKIVIPNHQTRRDLDGNIRWDISDEDFYPLYRLEEPYSTWAKKHLKKYPEIINSFEKLPKLAENQTKTLEELENIIKEKFMDEMLEKFPDFVRYQDKDNSDSYYIYSNIKTIIDVQLIYKATDPFEIKKYNDENFWLLSKHNGREYLITKDKNKLDISKFTQMLKNISEDSKVLEAIKKNDESYKLSSKETKTFRNNLIPLIKELDTGEVLIKGSCKNCK